MGDVPESCDGREAWDGDHNTEGDERKGKLAKSEQQSSHRACRAYQILHSICWRSRPFKLWWHSHWMDSRMDRRMARLHLWLSFASFCCCCSAQFPSEISVLLLLLLLLCGSSDDRLYEAFQARLTFYYLPLRNTSHGFQFTTVESEANAESRSSPP